MPTCPAGNLDRPVAPHHLAGASSGHGVGGLETETGAAAVGRESPVPVTVGITGIHHGPGLNHVRVPSSGNGLAVGKGPGQVPAIDIPAVVIGDLDFGGKAAVPLIDVVIDLAGALCITGVVVIITGIIIVVIENVVSKIDIARVFVIVNDQDQLVACVGHGEAACVVC